MTDVFISYSKSHRHLTEELARELEAKGLEVWWDTEMLAGESFRERIIEELKSCKAAIVIWTSESVKSPYVLSEAERARREGKLIQVRTADMAAENVPPPFDASHIALIDDRRSIYGALGRLGLIKSEVLVAMGAMSPGTPAPLTPSMWLWPVVALAAVTAAALAAQGWMRNAEPPAHPALAAIDSFFATLGSGLQNSSSLAPSVRLGRLGAMSRDAAMAELRKLNETYARINCRREGIAAAPADKAAKVPQAVRVTLTATCDFSDKSGRTTTKSFPLEVEVASEDGRSLISGLWQPQAEVLWVPLPRR